MSLASQVSSLATRVATEIKAVRAEMAARAIEPYPLSVVGAVTVRTGTSKIVMEVACVVETVRAYATTAPTGAALIVDVNKNGTTIYGTQANRPTIASGANSALGGAHSAGTFAVGDILSLDVDQVGSTVAGSDLTVTVRMRRT